MSTQTVLDVMTASVIERKAKAGAKLTPVGLEAAKAAPAALPHTAASFPNDVPDEAILSRVSILEDLFARVAAADEQQEELRRAIHVQYAAIREAMDAVKTALGQVAVADPADARKAKEKAADARVAAAKGSDIAATAEEDEPIELQAQADAAAALATIAAASTTTEKDAAVAEFVAQFEAKSAAAQAATFAQHPPAAPPSTWVCPVHRLSIEKVSRLGRTYRACNEASCKEFEKL